jgi:ribosome-associated protein
VGALSILQSGENNFEIAPGVYLTKSALRFSFSRSSGPGGQAVNKLSIRAELRVAVKDVQGLPSDAADRLRALAGRRLTQEDEIILHADASRSQLDNKHECLERLRAMVRAALVRPKRRKKKKPTRGMIERRLESKRKSSQKKNLRRTRRSGGGDD